MPAGNPGAGRWTDGDDFGGDARRDDGRVRLAENETDRAKPVDLREEGRLGGHALREHVGTTDEKMLARVKASGRTFPSMRYGLTRDGSFESIEIANDLVDRTVEQNSIQVDRVASSKDKKAFITHRFGYRTGREAYTAGRLEPYMRTTYGVGILIIHVMRSPRGYRVYTAYPRNDGD